MSVAMDDSVVIACPVAVQFVEREEKGVHGAQGGYGLGQCEAIDMEPYGFDIIAVYTVFIGVQLGLGADCRDGH